MRKNTLSDEQSDSIRFVLDLLEKHDVELNRLLSELNEVTIKLRENEGYIRDKIEEIDQRIKNFQSEISNYAKCRFISK